MVILGIGIYIFILARKKDISRIPNWKILTHAFYFLLGAWLFTNLEEFFLNNIFNYLEHIFYLISSILIVVWTWNTVVLPQKRSNND